MTAAPMPSTGDLPRLRISTAELPPVPPTELDTFLDAAARCFARHGIRRTSVPDIAQEASTSRTSVYRHLGTVDEAATLLLARDLHRLLIGLTEALQDADGPDSVIRLICGVVCFCQEHPVLKKVLNDEPELITPLITSQFHSINDRASAVFVPVLDTAMEHGMIRRADARVLTEFLVRVTMSILLSPPDGKLTDFLHETVLPAIRPTSACS